MRKKTKSSWTLDLKIYTIFHMVYLFVYNIKTAERTTECLENLRNVKSDIRDFWEKNKRYQRHLRMCFRNNLGFNLPIYSQLCFQFTNLLPTLDSIYQLYSQLWIQFTNLLPTLVSIHQLYSQLWIQFTYLLPTLVSIYQSYSQLWFKFTNLLPTLVSVYQYNPNLGLSIPNCYQLWFKSPKLFLEIKSWILGLKNLWN